MIRIIARLFAVILALTTFLPVAPLFAASVAYVSSTGNNANPCTAALPCQDFSQAAAALTPVLNGQVSCLNSPGPSTTGFGLNASSISFTIDCAGVYEVTFANFGAFQLAGANQAVRIRNLTISGSGGGFPAIKVLGSGTLILENCVFENIPGIALDIEPNGPFNLVVTDSRISNSSAGVLIKPAAGGSVTATFDRVTIVDNTGGGIKTDSTSGPVGVDISNSTISNNTGNGMNAVSGASLNMLNLSHNVIAKNGSAGIQVNGGFAAAVVDTTLIDSNVAGATSVINGGRLLTYGNNRLVGPTGPGFTGSSPLQ